MADSPAGSYTQMRRTKPALRVHAGSQLCATGRPTLRKLRTAPVASTTPAIVLAVMTEIEFSAWADAMHWGNSEISRRLHIARGTVIQYRIRGAPFHIGLAAAALAAGLGPWQAPATAPIGRARVRSRLRPRSDPGRQER